MFSVENYNMSNQCVNCGCLYESRVKYEKFHYGLCRICTTPEIEVYSWSKDGSEFELVDILK